MKSRDTRNAIVACLRAAINEFKLQDIHVVKTDSANKSPWPVDMEIVAEGDSIIDNLAGEQRVQTSLLLLELWLKR